MSNTRHLRSLILTLSIVLCVAVLLLSVLPVNRVALGTRPGAGFSRTLVHRAALIHFAVHVVGYGLLACLAWFVAAIVSRHAAGKAIALMLVLSLGFATEYLQHVVYKHGIEVNDVAANLLSTALVFGLMAIGARWRKSSFYRNMSYRTGSETEDIARVLRDPE